MIKLEKKVWYYILILFIITYLLQFFVIFKGGQDYEFFNLFIGISMFFPGLGAIFYLRKSKEGLKYINWRLGKPLYLFWGILLPIVITLVGIFIVEKIGLGENFAYYINDGKVTDIEMYLLLGYENQSIPFFYFNFVLTAIVTIFIVGLIIIGEEIGWRGFLQKKLLERNSTFKSLTFLGLIWGFWHFPIILDGFNYPEYPVLGAFLIFPLMAVFISYFIGLLTINSNSFWPAVLVHSGINSIMALLFEVDFGDNKFYANFFILGMWIIIGVVSFQLINKQFIQKSNEIRN